MRPSEAVVCTRPRQSLGSISGPLHWHDAAGVWVSGRSFGRIENVGAQLASGDLSPALLVEPPSKRAIEPRPLAQGLSQIADRRSSPDSKSRLIVWCQGA